jgi:hypothetical protein
VRTALCTGLLALSVATPAAAALPREGALVPGRSLGGVQLGESAAEVRAALGARYGVCRGCAHTTWYFTYRPFDAHGMAIELMSGRVSAVYTLWQPAGWHASRGLRLGAFEAQVTSLAGPVATVTCPGYGALVHDHARARDVYYVSGGRLWGFGLLDRGADPCR